MNGPPAAEVLVVGGGPAGLATAIAARLRGLDATVVDRAEPPIDKPCGEGLMPDAAACLEALGVDLAAARPQPFYGIRYLDGDVVAEGRFPAAPGLGIRRTRLHQALVERAEAAGVRLLWRTRVDGFAAPPPTAGILSGGRRRRDGAGRGVRVETSRGPFTARWLVAADGLRSPLRRRAGLAGRDEPRRRQRFGVRRHYRVAPWSDCVEVYWAEDREAYVTPVAADEVGIAILWRGGCGRFDGQLPAFPALAQRLRRAAPSSRDRGCGPLRQRVRGVVRGNLALVGDAAGYVDAITGEGLAVAFHQAHALADALAGGDLRPYARAHRRITA
ncbi:MAG: NAD(P)/FAD-dependent oxidoreductase, partial [Acidobacteria bacterium]